MRFYLLFYIDPLRTEENRENMKKIILFLRYPLTNKVGEAVIVPVESLQENLWEVCKKAYPDGKYFSFDRYYGRTELTSLGRMFPYILRDDVYVWNVPYSDLSIQEFLDTHGLTEQDMIEVEVDNVGSAGEMLLRLYQEWVSFAEIAGLVVDQIGRGMTVYSVLKWLYCSFGKKKESKPKVREFYQFLVSRNRWNVKVLAKRLSTDETFLKAMLEAVGFEDRGGGDYTFSREKNEKFGELCSAYMNSWSNNHGGEINCCGVNEEVFIINRNMLYLRILCSEIQANRIWAEAKKKLQELICQNSEYLFVAGDETTVCLKEQFPDGFGYEEESWLWGALHSLNTYLDGKIWPLEELLEREI